MKEREAVINTFLEEKHIRIAEFFNICAELCIYGVKKQ